MPNSGLQASDTSDRCLSPQQKTSDSHFDEIDFQQTTQNPNRKSVDLEPQIMHAAAGHIECSSYQEKSAMLTTTSDRGQTDRQDLDRRTTATQRGKCRMRRSRTKTRCARQRRTADDSPGSRTRTRLRSTRQSSLVHTGSTVIARHDGLPRLTGIGVHHATSVCS